MAWGDYESEVDEEYKREIVRIRAEKDPVKRKALLYKAHSNLYIWQHVCHAFEEAI